MVYIIRHVRFIQQAEFDREIKVYQVDGWLNPTDPFTKYMPGTDKRRHYLFLMGFPAAARRMWLDSAKFKTWKPKKLVPVSELETAALRSES